MVSDRCSQMFDVGEKGLMHNTPSALPIGTKLAEREGGRQENDFIQTMNEVRVPSSSCLR